MSEHYVTYRYRAEILVELANHGIIPKPTTSPQTARAALNEIYRYELRRLRERLLRGEFLKDAYLAKVVEIRNRYRVMALPARLWAEEERRERQEGREWQEGKDSKL